MSKIHFLVLGLFLGFYANGQTINFPDPAFKTKLLSANTWNHVAENAAGVSVVIDTNNDGNIQVSEALVIRKMDVYNGGFIQSIVGIEYFTNLTSLVCSYNGIASIDVSMLTGLKILKCENQALTSLNVNGLTQLEELNAGNCNLTSLNLTSLSSLKKLFCYSNDLTTLDLSGLSSLEEVNCSSNLLTTIITNGLTNLKILDCGINQLASFDATNLLVLESLTVFHNPNLTSLTIAGMQTLKFLDCDSCNLSALALNDLPSLINLRCGSNSLVSIDFSELNSILGIDCTFNQLTSLDFGDITTLKHLDCSANQLSNLNIQNLVNLEVLRCNSNILQQLDVTPFQQITSLDCSSNQLQYLNCGMLHNLQFLFCYENQLEYLNIKNGRNEGCDFWGNSTLDYICVDESQRQSTQIKVSTYLQYYGMGQCVVGDYCSFVPGGVFYKLEGNSKWDMNSNGCDVNDAIYPNLKLSITNGIVTSNFISDSGGSYSFPVENGTHTISPILENPSYYNVSPTSFQATFPEETSPYIQHFCFLSTGNHSDLEVTLLPMTPARPGFESIYKIVYRNKGTITLSGAITFQFEDAKMDLVSSTPLFSSQATGLLTYNYTNLQPFETREITITMNINTPQENPAVNLGDQLNFTAIINPLSGDEYLPDNTSSLKQIVVGSYDPNDKTCVEGNEVGPESIGQYVHYVIRFENTGTFPAENIVVKDMIDLTKFDLSTLIPISSSHSFITRIAADGKVEFIFESIQLPFDDANNDGYVAFKIKTLPSLAVGNTFSNKANIYFDYNFPIETNTAITSIQALGNSDFNLDEYITLYPNPVKNELNIKVNNEISISSVNIYNALGQLVLVATNPSESIDVSGLKTGCYFVKVISDKGTSNGQIIKE